VANGTRYYYVVSSVNNAGESANSSVASATPLAAPVAPTSLGVTVVKGNKSAKLAWKQSTSPAIQSNVIYRSVNGGAYAQLAQIPTGTTFSDNTVRSGVTYSYAVTAVNINGAPSPYSSAVTVRIK
jgi:fibronectin type 3 domain-containing protein